MNRRELMITAVAAGLFFGGARSGREERGRPPELSRYGLWYSNPARYWVEALPVGTGRLGAMAYGGTGEERLQLNEDTFWAGGPYDPANPDAIDVLPEVRELIWQGRFAEAQAAADARMMGRPPGQMPYQTLGALSLEMAEAEEPSEYVRWLDLERAETVTSWTAGGRRFRRTVAASAADEVLLVRWTVDRGPLSVSLRHEEEAFTARGEAAWLTGSNGSARGVDGRLTYALAAQPCGEMTEGRVREGRLALEGEGEVSFLIAAATSYKQWNDVSADPAAIVAERLASAAGQSPPSLIDRHRTRHAQAFSSFDLDLGADPFPDVPTNERIRYSHEMGRDDPYLAALYVQYGRYLLLSSSQPGSQPANLQGLWNDSDTPAWDSKYTVNINTEMNYWPAEPLGLPACVEPLIAMVEDLAEAGSRTARVQYGARGWVTHHNTDVWRATAAIDGAFWGMWPLGGAWLCQHLWDHWDFGRDRAVLERIYPTIRDAGLFFLDTLVAHPDGSGLVTCPSLSPENAHHDGVTICAGPACDRQILRQLFGSIIEASSLLSVDKDLRTEFAEARSRLPADRIGKAGQLQEWLEDWDLDAPEIQHRHVSHLYGVHPGHEIGEETPELYKAAYRSLAIRGDDATGWGIAWRINLWARLGDTDRAYGALRKLLGPDRTYPNMFDAHPPFQIDGNLGGAAGIVEMLVRDRPQQIDLLPALPRTAWPTGSLRGVRVRGGATLDLRWRDGLLAEAMIKAATPIKRRIKYRGRIKAVSLDARQSARITFDD